MSVPTIDESFVVVAKRAIEIDAYDHMILIRDHVVNWLADPKHQAFVKSENAWNFIKNLPGETSRWVARIRHLRIWDPEYLKYLMAGGAGRTIQFQMAMARIAAQEAMVARAAAVAPLNAAAAATKGTLVAGAGTTIACIVVPVVGMIAVQVALGAGYAQAREQARKDGYASGFAKGLITGLLKWELRFAIERFWDDAVDKNYHDEALPKIRANAHNQALIHGRAAGLARNDEEKKDYLLALRKLTKTSTAGWTPRVTGNEYHDWLARERAQVVQSSYVIELAAAATKYGFTAVF